MAPQKMFLQLEQTANETEVRFGKDLDQHTAAATHQYTITSTSDELVSIRRKSQRVYDLWWVQATKRMHEPGKRRNAVLVGGVSIQRKCYNFFNKRKSQKRESGYYTERLRAVE
jgi:hypothetical protein